MGSIHDILEAPYLLVFDSYLNTSNILQIPAGDVLRMMNSRTYYLAIYRSSYSLQYASYLSFKNWIILDLLRSITRLKSRDWSEAPFQL